MTRRLATLLAAAAIALPVLALQGPLRAQTTEINSHAEPERHRPELGLERVATAPFRVLQEARHPDPLAQVRIQQRVIIRISPSSAAAREQMMANLQRRENEASRQSFEEVKHDDCITITDIAGVTATRDNRLLLFMRDRKVLAASLERTCTAQAFYSGFYVERSDDGRLCIKRDRLQSRAGANCQLAALNRIVTTSN